MSKYPFGYGDISEDSYVGIVISIKIREETKVAESSFPEVGTVVGVDAATVVYTIIFNVIEDGSLVLSLHMTSIECSCGESGPIGATRMDGSGTKVTIDYHLLVEVVTVVSDVGVDSSSSFVDS